MKRSVKWIIWVLCAVLALSLAGCTGNSESIPTTEATTVPTEPPAEEIYAQARAALDSAADVTVELVITTYTTVDGDEFSQQASQTLTYQAMGTDAALIAMEEETAYSIHSEDSDPDGEEAEPMLYKEVWSQGTVYAELDETYRYRGPVDVQETASRYTPVVLLDAALYGSITSETTGSGTLLTFSEPTAPETWSVPQEAELVEASGSALVSAEGTLEEMCYTVTYLHGPAEVTVEVRSQPLDTAQTAAIPEDPDSYAPISYVDALVLTRDVTAMLMQADSVAVSGLESIFCEAAGVLYNQSTGVQLHGRRASTKAKVDSGVYFMNYGNGQSESYDMEETYLNGKLTTVVNNGLPSSESGITWQEVRDYAMEQMTYGMLAMDYWQDVTLTEMDSVYFLEYQLNDNFGNTMQNKICQMLWNDPSFLYNLASEYSNAQVNGYLSVDKYTGLPVAAGYYYEGIHTIDGQDYALTQQFDQSIEAPAKGAYQEITGQMPQEEEPENKPTPLFYHVTGPDGQEMWLFGTIHLGDERTAYLPAEIYDAFAASDALALECDTEAFEKQVEEDDDLSQQVSDHYFYSNGTTIESLMEEEAYAQALKKLKAAGGYNMNMPYAKPYLWSDAIDMFYLRQGYQLHGDQGVEERLCDWAAELDKEILEVESSLFQIQMLTGFSDELQLLMLETSLETNAREYWEGTMELYEKWCAGDEAVLREEISDIVDTSEMTEEELAEYEEQKPLMEEYNEAVSHDRNEGMLKKAIEYLESGDVIFYAVGLAHLLDETNGLVDTLRDAGYTVEQVIYAN